MPKIRVKFAEIVIVLVAELLLVSPGLMADDLDFSDPAHLTPPAAARLGWPSRDPNLDALPGFEKPLPGYGPIAGWWWSGPDRLTKERIAYQLDEMKKLGFMGLQVNYSHLEDSITPERRRTKALFSRMVGAVSMDGGGRAKTRHGDRPVRL